MLVLDTDAVSVFVDPRDSLYSLLQRRLSLANSEEVASTVVSIQVQMDGRLTPVRRARTFRDIHRAYAGLARSFAGMQPLRFLPYTTAVHDRFIEFRSLVRQIGTLDLRIVCIALANNATLLSRNLRDFRQVPGLAVEDWSK